MATSSSETSPIRTIYKSTDDYIYTTGDTHTVTEQLAFHNAAGKDYFVDMTLDLTGFENAIITQNSLRPSLCLYMHTKAGDFVGLSRTCTFFFFCCSPIFIFTTFPYHYVPFVI
jgi:hypothetical protein